ncbi:MAG: type II secretion system protein GspE, partial [Phycisphaerae bacterium]
MAIGEILVSRGMITREQLADCAAARNGHSTSIDDALVRKGLISERDLLQVYGEQFGMKVVELSESDIDRELLAKVPSHLVHKYALMPIARHGKGIRVATADPNNLYALDELRTLIDMAIEPVLATR